MTAWKSRARIHVAYSFVPFPQDIWKQGTRLTVSGYRLLGYLLMHAIREGRLTIEFEDGELLNGRLDRKGHRTDRGCLVRGRNNLKAARQQLSGLGWIEVEQISLGRYLYRIKLPLSESDAAANDSKCPTQPPVVSNTEDPLSKSDDVIRNEKVKGKVLEEREHPDPRYGEVEQAIRRLQKHSFDYEIWDESAKRSLAQLLISRPDASTAKLIDCLVNLWLSPERMISANPSKYLLGLTDYQLGPVNKFRDVITCNPTDACKLKAIARAESIQSGNSVAKASGPGTQFREIEIDSSPEGRSWTLIQPSAAWIGIRGYIKPRITPYSFQTWLTPLRQVSIEGGVLELRAATPELLHAAVKYRDEIESAVLALNLPLRQVRITSDE